MKKKLFLIGMALVALAGCSRTPEVEPEVVVEVENSPGLLLTKVGSTLKNRFEVKITPNSTTAMYEYALCLFEDRQALESFEKGTLEKTVRVNNGDEAQIAFEGLVPETNYTVYARGYDAEGNNSAVAMLSARTNSEDNFITGVQYVTNTSAGFTVITSPDCYKFDYALGKAGDRAKFENGSLDGLQTKEESFEYTFNYFDLEPDTEYLFFTRGYDRAGNSYDIYETEIRTYADGASPDIVFTKETDAFWGEYVFTPNKMCGKIIAFVSPAGKYEEAIYSDLMRRGDIVGTLEDWSQLENPMALSATDSPLGLFYQTPGLLTDVELESYVLIYGNDRKPFGVKKFSFKNCEYDSDLPQPEVSVAIKDITTVGATYEFTIDENTLGFLFDTIDADWYDEFKTTAEFYPEYLRELFIGRGYYWRYKTDLRPFMETAGAKGKRYYVAVCPMNGNGISDSAWGELYLKEFTTATE